MTTGLVAGAIAVGGTGMLVIGLLRRRTRSGAGFGDTSKPRWLAVTIDRAADDVLPAGRVPPPLADLGPTVEVETRVAPGDKGTELRARPRRPAPTGIKAVVARLSGDDPRQEIRAALRETKQLIEVGEVLRVNPVPHGRRPATPWGKVVDLLAERAPREGLL